MLGVVLAAWLSGCVTQKVLQATGGSRSDGTVKMSYQVGLFEKAQVDMNQGAMLAAQRCRAWGYSDAEPFGGSTSVCQQRNAYGNCLDAIVTIEYQCTNAQERQQTEFHMR